MVSMAYSTNKDMDKEVRELVRQRGWQFTPGRKHNKLTHPDYPDQTVVVAKSPSDHKAVLNFRAQLKRLEQGRQIVSNLRGKP